MNNLREFLSPYRNEIEPVLGVMLPETSGMYQELYGMLRYHLGWLDEQLRPFDHLYYTGKRIRATICLMAGELVGGQREAVLLAAAAIECLHEFSLIHDDIEDGDQIRRHRPTVWSIWGVAQAINAGDVLLTIAQQTMLQLVACGVSAEIVCTLSHRFQQTIISLCRGQYLDISFEQAETVTPEQYLEMIAGKTAAVLAFSAETGTTLGGGSQKQIAASQQFGHHLGMAFQLQDDLLGLWGDTAQTGKIIGADLRKHKKSYPIILALNHPSSAGKQFRTLYAQSHLTDADLDTGLALMKSCGVLAQTQALLDQTYLAVDNALAILEANMTSVQQSTPLRQLVSLLTVRTG